jgi:isopenicillin-N epimerase
VSGHDSATGAVDVDVSFRTADQKSPAPGKTERISGQQYEVGPPLANAFRSGQSGAMPTGHLAAFALDPGRLTLNHGSFGACLRSTLAAQDTVRAELEADPTGFYEHRYPLHMERTRAAIARLCGCDEAGLVFVTNATMGVATVLASLRDAGHLLAGDELLTTDHVYPACKNALSAMAEKAGARLVVAPVPFPITGPQEVVDAVIERVTERTKLVLLDHVTSPTGLVFPVEILVPALEARGIPVLVDGAHAPGMVPLALEALGPSFYTGNLHKWVGAPKSSALLWARHDRRALLHPLVVSHGHGKGLFAEFDWTGTFDPSALFAVPSAIDGLAALHEDGLPGLMAALKARAVRAQGALADALSIARPAPASMLGTLVSVPLPPRTLACDERDPDRAALEQDLSTRIPFFPWPAPPERLLRLSIAAYVSDDDVASVAGWLRQRSSAR